MFGELLSSWDVGQPRQKASHVCVCSIRAPGIPALGVRLVADCPVFALRLLKGLTIRGTTASVQETPSRLPLITGREPVYHAVSLRERSLPAFREESQV